MGKKPETTLLLETMETGKAPNPATGGAGNKILSSVSMGEYAKGILRTVHSPILTRALNNAFLKKTGCVSLKDITTPVKTVNV